MVAAVSQATARRSGVRTTTAGGGSPSNPVLVSEGRERFGLSSPGPGNVANRPADSVFFGPAGRYGSAANSDRDPPRAQWRSVLAWSRTARVRRPGDQSGRGRGAVAPTTTRAADSGRSAHTVLPPGRRGVRRRCPGRAATPARSGTVRAATGPPTPPAGRTARPRTAFRATASVPPRAAPVPPGGRARRTRRPAS